MIELKERLAAVASYVPDGSCLIDVGTDHAYLPIHLVQAGVCQRAIGTDIHSGPYKVALEQVLLQGLTGQIEIYLGDGLAPVRPGRGDVLVVAGMGGTTIIDILRAGCDVLIELNRLILQPMVAGGALRNWLAQNGWAIHAECLVEEDKRIYEIIVAEKGVQEELTWIERELGPLIIASKDRLLRRLVESKVLSLEGILHELGKAEVRKTEMAVKQAEIRARIKELRGVLL